MTRKQRIRTCNNLMELFKLATTNRARALYVRTLERSLENMKKATAATVD